jgi:hypothetical protein
MDREEDMDTPAPPVTNIVVGTDYETSAHAGMEGAFQISLITDEDTGDDLTGSVDQGLHFQDQDECDRYLKKTFGPQVSPTYEHEVS